jgi:hypothetical protein
MATGRIARIADNSVLSFQAQQLNFFTMSSVPLSMRSTERHHDVVKVKKHTVSAKMLDKGYLSTDLALWLACEGSPDGAASVRGTDVPASVPTMFTLDSKA